jgi:ethanolamine utilization protein EutN
MILGKIIGNVVSTAKVKGYESKIILIVQPVDKAGTAVGKSFLALDAIQAGVGDTVLVVDEGNSARAVLKEPDSFTIKTVVYAIVDLIS